jgi:hypothetical protein
MGVQLADKIHDWTTITEVSKHAEPAPYVVEDPHGTFKGEKIKVLRALRDDPLADMHNRGQIDDPLFMAARKLQATHRRATVGSISAIDTTKDVVDGGKGYEGLTNDQVDAFKELKEVDKLLGPNVAFVVRAICLENLSATALAKRLSGGSASGHRREWIMGGLRTGLGKLVVYWGFGTHGFGKKRT